jgi:hypothetical protein
MWVVRTLEMHRGRRLTCGTRSSIKSEVKNGLSTHQAPCALLPRAEASKGHEFIPQTHSGSETRGPYDHRERALKAYALRVVIRPLHGGHYFHLNHNER